MPWPSSFSGGVTFSMPGLDAMPASGESTVVQAPEKDRVPDANVVVFLESTRDSDSDQDIVVTPVKGVVAKRTAADTWRVLANIVASAGWQWADTSRG